MKRFRQRKAFTIVEMVIVIAVIAILATVLVPTFGGIIQKANHSADTQFVASLNVQLAMWQVDNGEIASESDLRKAIDEFYGDGFYSELAPKSAPQGYHYWWNAEDNVVELAKYEELIGDVAPATLGQLSFSPASPRSLLIPTSEGEKNYFLMDQEGSDVIDVIIGFENLGDDSKVGSGSSDPAQQYEYSVNKLINAEVGTLEAALFAKVEKTTIVTGTGAYRFNDIDAVDHVYIPASATIINVQKVYEYTTSTSRVITSATFALATAAKVPVVQIPVGVKIASNGFPAMAPCTDPSASGNYQSATVLEILADDMSALTNADNQFMFDLQTSYPVFKLMGSSQLYVVIEGGVYTLPYAPGDASVNVGGELGTGTSENLDVVVSFPNASENPGEGTHYYDSVNKILYVQYDQESLPISVVNGTYVTWEYSADGLVSVSGDTLSILKKIAVADNNQVVVTGKINGEEKVSFTVCLIMPREVQVGTFNSTTDGVGVIGAQPIKLDYDTTDTFTFTFAVGYGDGQNGKVGTWDVTVDSENDKFTPTLNEAGTELTITLGAEHEFEDVLIVTVGEEEYKFTVKVEDKSGAAFTKAPVRADSDVLVGDNYLFRVGNKNAITLKRLFTTTQPYTEVVVKFYDWSTANHPAIGGNVAHSQTVTVTGAATKGDDKVHWYLSREQWNSDANVSVQFNKIGVVKIEIGHMDNGVFKADKEVFLEVVDGTNVYSYSQLKGSGNRVLWADIEMSENDTYSLSGATLFGNGYTFDVSKGAYKATANGYTSESYLINLSNATLDNVKIVGKVYTEFNITPKSDYNRAIVLASGNSYIYNSYISNGGAPVRIYTGTLAIDNTTLKGGSFANLDVHGGQITLRDVTTINQVNGNDKADNGTTPIGLGVAVWYEQVNNATTITIEGTLKQYNFIAQSHTSSIKNSYAKAFVEKAFSESAVAPYRYSDGSTTWVNTGILSMIEEFGADNLKPATISGYGKRISVSASSKTGMLCTVETNASNYASTPTEWVPEQEEIAPTYTWDWTSKNYVEKTGGSNDYCYHDGSKVQISMDEGDTKNWDVSILTANKLGNHPTYRVFMNGVEYTGGTIPFSAAGDYIVEYVVTDPYNYNVNGEKYPKDYKLTVEVTVSVVKAAAKNATFDFAGNGYDEVTIGNDTYIMPKSGNSITINGTTVRYVLINCEPSNGKYENSSTSYWNMIYPVFYNVITITDYADGGTGAAVTYGATTTSMPSGLSLAGHVSKASSVPSGAKTFSTETSAGKIFQYDSSSEAATAPTTFKMDGSNRLVYKSPSLSNNGRSENWMLVRYQYQDNVGKTYYYVVCYHTPPMIEGSGGCVTPDTLVTLADGTQKEIQYITYADQLKVWNFYEGKYEIVPAAIIFNMGTDYFDVLTLKFDDGTTVKTINGHRFFDTTVNNFELISTANVENYVGHEFAKVDGDGYRTVKLVDYSIENEYTTSYSIMSAFHYNFIVEGMFSDTFHKEDAPLFDYFQMGSDMMYDADQMQKDIEQYGLYTYEEFADYLTYEQFAALNVQYLKIAVEKGQFTYEGILNLINTYLND